MPYFESISKNISIAESSLKLRSKCDKYRSVQGLSCIVCILLLVFVFIFKPKFNFIKPFKTSPVEKHRKRQFYCLHLIS